jgi:hypothetical protein
MDTNGAIVAGMLALWAMRWQSSDGTILYVDGAHELALEVQSIVDGLQKSGPFAGVFAKLQLEETYTTLEAVSQKFQRTKSDEEARQKKLLRQKELDGRRVRALESGIVRSYERSSLTRRAPEVFVINSEPLAADPAAQGIGYNLRLPKDLLTHDSHASGLDRAANDYGVGLDRAEIASILTKFASEMQPRLVHSGELMETLAQVCAMSKGGLLFLRTGGSVLGLHRHPDFVHAQDEAYGPRMLGTLSDIPVLLAWDAKGFDAAYLPPKSVSVRYADYGENGPVFARVEFFDAERAEDIVRGWEEDGSEMTSEQREAKISELQESVGLRTFIRYEASVEGGAIFTVDKESEECL